jgi:hypothetical protein
MRNIPGLSVEAGGTDNLPGVTQGIGWEMFNSTDENMEVLISAEQLLSIAPDPLNSSVSALDRRALSTMGSTPAHR